MEVRILGPVEAHKSNGQVALGGPAQQALLVLLALNANRVVPADRLLDKLWPDEPPKSGLTALHNRVAQLRKLLEPRHVPGTAYELLASRPPGYVLRLDPEQVDASRFERLLGQGRRARAEGRPGRAAEILREALTLWRGPAFGELCEEPALQADAARFEDLRLVALEERIEADLALGRHAELIGELRALVSDQPLRERPRAQLMLALYRAGRQADALAEYQSARSTLVEELGIQPSDELRRLEQAILNQDPSLAAPPIPTARTNLPFPATRLIGRRTEFEGIRELLDEPHVRLVTLTGAGGSGKSRLAAEVAGSSLDRFADGVFLVRLASITEPGLVLPTIAQTLGVTEGARPLAEALAGDLRAREILLLLDNFEHVLPAAAEVARLLAAAPELKLLVTSRAPLRVFGEHEYPVAPLPVPGRHAWDLESVESVTLFLERARAVRPDFELTPETASSIAEICVQLDGLPLALELAAARVKVLSPRAILDRLDRQLSVLTGGARDLPARQQTLRATLDWSYHLLEPPHQRLFADLAVFAGSFSLDSVEAVCGSPDALEDLTTLVDNNLLLSRERADGEPRFGMLRTIREYALELLSTRGEAVAVLGRHAHFIADFAERAEPELTGRQQSLWLERLEDEHDNLRAALAWSLENGESELLLRLAAAACRFWFTRCHLSEGLRWIEAALAVECPAELGTMRARALSGGGLIALRQGNSARAKELLEECLGLRHELGDDAGAALCLTHLGLVARGDRDLQGATELFEASARLFRELSNAWGLGAATMNLAELASWSGDYERAAELSLESVHLFRELGDGHGAAFSLLVLGTAEAGRGRLEQARGVLGESLSGMSDVGDAEGIAHCLDALARVYAELTEAERAAQLLGAAESLRERVGDTLQSIERDHRERTVADVRSRLEEGVFTAALDQGRAMTIEQAVACALPVAAAAKV